MRILSIIRESLVEQNQLEEPFTFKILRKPKANGVAGQLVSLCTLGETYHLGYIFAQSGPASMEQSWNSDPGQPGCKAF